MPLFGVGSEDAATDEKKLEDTDSFQCEIDPMTMLSVIRAQNESKTPTETDISVTKVKKSKNGRKIKKKTSTQSVTNVSLKKGEILAKQGQYYSHQVEDQAFYCTDRKGDAENKIFKRIYHGELAVYRSLNKSLYGFPPLPRKKKKTIINRYFSTHNEQVLKAAPAPTARSVKNRLEIQKLVDEQASKLTIYETELIVDHDNETEIDILQLKTRDYNRKLQEEKENINLWLEFVDFQDAVFKDQVEKAENGKNVSQKSLCERKIAILERALDENQKSIRLRVEVLKLGASIWTEDELKKRWEGLVFSNPHLPELWRHFLDIQARKPIRSVLKYYNKCFETLSSISEGSYATAPPQNLEEEMILIFQQMISFLSLAGQTEKSTALCQAIIELNVFCPTVLRQRNRENKLKAFEFYWESNVPRIGENGHICWAEWFMNGQNEKCKETSDSMNEDDYENSLVDADEAAGLTWARFEVNREKNNWLPLRSLEHDEDLIDPDRRIKFHEIRSLLFCLHEDELLLRLCFSCLRYFGGITLSDMTPGDLQFNEFINRRLHSVGQLLFNMNLKKKTTVVEAIDSLSGLDCDNMTIPAIGQSYDVDRKIFHYLPKKNNQVVLKIIQQVIEKSEQCGSFKDDFSCISFGTNAIYYCTLRLKAMKLVEQRVDKKHKEYKELKKLIKSVLRRQQFRGNVIPWCQFGLFELETSGFNEVLNEIYLQALQLAWSLKQKSSKQKAILSLFYVLAQVSDIIMIRSNEHAYSESIKNSLISILGCILLDEESPVLNKNYNNKQILKIRLELQTLYNDLKYEYSENIISYYGWFWGDSSFLNVLKVSACLEFVLENNIESTVKIINDGFQCIYDNLQKFLIIYDPSVLDDTTVRRRRSDLYSIHQLKVQYMINYSSGTTLRQRITTIRSLISNALSDFPESPQFLAWWLTIESQTVGVQQQNNLKLVQTSALRQLFLILYELENEKKVLNFEDNQVVLQTGLHHRIRAKFETMVNSFPQCTVGWRLYLAFEKKLGNQVNYKRIFYRAVEFLPFIKSFYIDACINLPYRVDEFLRSLSDRELRIRSPIEEIRMLLDAPEGEVVNTEETNDPNNVTVEIVETVNLLDVKHERAQRSPSREMSPNRMDDVEDIQDLEDEYDSIPAYEAPHKRNENESSKRKRGVQYPDREFDRRWERKKREAEEAKNRELNEKRRRKEERYYSDDETSYYRSRSRSFDSTRQEYSKAARRRSFSRSCSNDAYYKDRSPRTGYNNRSYSRSPSPGARRQLGDYKEDRPTEKDRKYSATHKRDRSNERDRKYSTDYKHDRTNERARNYSDNYKRDGSPGRDRKYSGDYSRRRSNEKDRNYSEDYTRDRSHGRDRKYSTNYNRDRSDKDRNHSNEYSKERLPDRDRKNSGSYEREKSSERNRKYSSGHMRNRSDEKEVKYSGTSLRGRSNERDGKYDGDKKKDQPGEKGGKYREDKSRDHQPNEKNKSRRNKSPTERSTREASYSLSPRSKRRSLSPREQNDEPKPSKIDSNHDMDSKERPKKNKSSKKKKRKKSHNSSIERVHRKEKKKSEKHKKSVTKSENKSLKTSKSGIDAVALLRAIEETKS